MKNLNWHCEVFFALGRDSETFGQKSSVHSRGKKERKVINNSSYVDGAALHTIKLDKMRLSPVQLDYVAQAINKILKSLWLVASIIISYLTLQPINGNC